MPQDRKLKSIIEASSPPWCLQVVEAAFKVATTSRCVHLQLCLVQAEEAVTGRQRGRGQEAKQCLYVLCQSTPIPLRWHVGELTLEFANCRPKRQRLDGGGAAAVLPAAPAGDGSADASGGGAPTGGAPIAAGVVRGVSCIMETPASQSPHATRWSLRRHDQSSYLDSGPSAQPKRYVRTKV